MITRRVFIAGAGGTVAAMTIPGAGGQTPPRPDQQVQSGQAVPVSPGGNVVVARRVIIIGTGGELLVYSPTAGAGNLIAAIAGSTGTDNYGDGFFQGVQSISGNVVALLESGTLQLQAAAGQIAGGFSAEVASNVTAGALLVSSGGTTGGDTKAQIELESTAASGAGTPVILLLAGQVQLNTVATSNIPSTNVNPGHQSAAPAAYSQSYEQASTNRINEIMDVLSQTGIWPL